MKALEGDCNFEIKEKDNKEKLLTLLHQQTTKLCRNRADTVQRNLHVFCATPCSYEDPSDKKRLHQNYSLCMFASTSLVIRPFTSISPMGEDWHERQTGS